MRSVVGVPALAPSGVRSPELLRRKRSSRLKSPVRLLSAVAGIVLAAAMDAAPLPASSAAPDVGQKAPEFRLPDSHGTIVSLPEPRAESSAGNWTLLVFYRGYW